MGQYCSDDHDCCSSKDKNAEIMPAALPRTMEEELGSPGHELYTHMESNEEEEDGAVTSASYFHRDLEELALLQKKGGVTSMKPHRFSSGAVYTGQWQNHMRHGNGLQTWPDGASYSGQWQNNIAVGKGRFTHSDGDMYVGEWSNNMANGMGIFFRSGIRIYQGEVRADLQHGHGVEIKMDGARYEGTFISGQKEGLGCYYWADGSEYYGSWRDDCVSGHGIYFNRNWSFKGQWTDSQKHGLGHYFEPDGCQYSGGFRSDKQNGFGKYAWSDGGIYQGFWFNGRETGPGVSTCDEDGIEVVGHWRDGELIKRIQGTKLPDRAA